MVVVTSVRSFLYNSSSIEFTLVHSNDSKFSDRSILYTWANSVDPDQP